MLASVIPETREPEVITIEDVPAPDIGSEDVLIEVKASAVNHTDVWIRRGYEEDPPIITGIDVAGVVAEIGADVEEFAPGDRVVLYWNTTYCDEFEFCDHGETTMCHDYGGLGVKTDGGHTEYVAVTAKHAVTLPDDVSFEAAAAIPSNFASAWRSLITRADLEPSDAVLVLRASGSIGHSAVQIGARAGATVYAASSSEKKMERLRELGVDHVIGYTETDIDDAVEDLTDGRGVDVIVESIGGETYKQAVRSLARGGRLVTIGATMGEFEDMLGPVFDGDIEPVIDQIIGLEDIPDAHERIAAGDGFGKIIIRP